MLKVDFKKYDAKNFVQGITDQAIKKSMKSSINKALNAAYNEGFKIAKRERRMNSTGDSPLSYVKSSKKTPLKLIGVGNQGAYFESSANSISMIYLVDDPLEPEDQRGLKLHQRRKLYARIRQGKITPLGGGTFIARPFAKGNGFNCHVFFRWTNKVGKEIMHREAVPGVHATLSQGRYQSAMEMLGRRKFQKTFDASFNRVYEKLLRKYGDK